MICENNANSNFSDTSADGSWLRNPPWGGARKDDGGNNIRDARDGSDIASSISGSFRSIGFRPSDDRFDQRDFDDLACTICPSILAYGCGSTSSFAPIGSLQSCDRSVDASCGISNDASRGILASSAPISPSNLASSTTANAQRQRSVLANLITTIEPCDGEKIATELLYEFGNLARVWTQTPEALSRVLGKRSTVAALLIAARAALIESMQSELTGIKIDLADPQLIHYLMASMGGLSDEVLRVLFLDAGRRLIADEQLQYGALSQLALYPRTIFRRAMEHNAAGLLLVHNHPSGDPSPSTNDIDVTQLLTRIGRSLEIEIVDHIIVTSQNWQRVPKQFSKIETAVLASENARSALIGDEDIRAQLTLLNRKHLEVLQGFAQLKSSKEIARELHISHFTVEQRSKRIRAVLGVRTRQEAAKLYLRVHSRISDIEA